MQYNKNTGIRFLEARKWFDVDSSLTLVHYFEVLL